MIPTRIGQKFPGGYFAGFNTVGNDCYAIIVAPKWTESELQIKTIAQLTPNTKSPNDGLLNTLAMNTTEHPAAQHCLGLTVNGCNDFYLPSLNELELCYRNLKPGTQSNYIPLPLPGRTKNPLLAATVKKRSFIPKGSEYTSANPSVTVAVAFNTRSTESFETNWYWTSCSGSPYTMVRHFGSGKLSWYLNTDVGLVRGIRRIQIQFL